MLTFDFNNAVNLEIGLGVRQGHCKCYHSIERIRLPNWRSIVSISCPLWDIQCWKCRDLEIRVKGHSRSLEPNRSATYDFLLTLRTYHEPTSYRFRDKWRFQSKITNFPTIPPRVFNAPVKGSSWNWVSAQGVKKLEWWVYWVDKRSLTISSAIRNARDRQTDGRTDTGPQQRRRLRIASRGKNKNLCGRDGRTICAPLPKSTCVSL